jgi:hypothetical protein
MPSYVVRLDLGPCLANFRVTTGNDISSFQQELGTPFLISWWIKCNLYLAKKICFLIWIGYENHVCVECAF